jgi:hypothetical protein
MPLGPPTGEASSRAPQGEPIEVGGDPFHLAALDFGPDSVDGWLNRIAAAELGESDQPFLDERDRKRRSRWRSHTAAET